MPIDMSEMRTIAEHVRHNIDLNRITDTEIVERLRRKGYKRPCSYLRRFKMGGYVTDKMADAVFELIREQDDRLQRVS